MIEKMKSLINDRWASVCKAFDEKMANYKNELWKGKMHQPIFLFCNAHFLLALCSAAEDGICAIENYLVKTGGSLGRDAQPVFAHWQKK